MGTLTVEIQDNQRLSFHCVEEITLTPITEFLDPTDPDWTRMLVIKTRRVTVVPDALFTLWVRKTPQHCIL